MALPFTLKSILRQKKNCRNSNISPCKNIVFKKSSIRNQNPSRHCNSRTNLRFQHKPNTINPEGRKERREREKKERKKRSSLKQQERERERERERVCVVCV
jgi:hypothetical protein